MRMLRWVCGVTKLDGIRNERIRRTAKVGEISKKVQKRRSKWLTCHNVMRRHGRYIRQGRPTRRWMNSANVDLREKGLSAGESKLGCVEATGEKHRPDIEVFDKLEQ